MVVGSELSARRDCIVCATLPIEPGGLATNLSARQPDQRHRVPYMEGGVVSLEVVPYELAQLLFGDQFRPILYHGYSGLQIVISLSASVSLGCPPKSRQ